MMKSTELAVRSRATAPQGGAVFCKSVGVLQAAVRKELWLISEHRLRAPPGGTCLFWNAALVPTEGASPASDVAPARGTLSSGMEPLKAREQRVRQARIPGSKCGDGTGDEGRGISVVHPCCETRGRRGLRGLMPVEIECRHALGPDVGARGILEHAGCHRGIVAPHRHP